MQIPLLLHANVNVLAAPFPLIYSSVYQPLLFSVPSPTIKGYKVLDTATPICFLLNYVRQEVSDKFIFKNDAECLLILDGITFIESRFYK